MSGEGPVVETAGVIAAEPEFKAIEVSHVRDELTRARLKVLLSSAGLGVIFNALPEIARNNWDLNSESAEARDEAVAGLKSLMEEAKLLGASLFTVMSGPDTAPEGRAAARGRLAESLGKLCDAAAPLGLSVSLEPGDREVDLKRLIGPTPEAVEVAKQVKRDSFGLTLDLAHLVLLKEGPADAVSLARNYILHAQIGNAVLAENHPARGDQHPAFGAEGGLVGPDQIYEFLRALEKYGFYKKAGGGWVSLEVRPREEEYSSALMAGALRVLAEVRARL